MAKFRCRSFVREDASSRDSVRWFECGGKESERAEGHCLGASSREAAIQFANGLAMVNGSVINFSVEYDEKNRRVVSVFYWLES